MFVGHDWGGFIVWQMPLLHPERVAGVVGLNTPYLPRLPIPPTEVFRMVGGDSMYILEFQEPGVADEILLRDVPGLFDALFRTAASPEEMALAVAATPAGPDAPTTFERIVAAPRMGEPLLDAARDGRLRRHLHRRPASPAGSTGTATSTATGRRPRSSTAPASTACRA